MRRLLMSGLVAAACTVRVAAGQTPAKPTAPQPPVPSTAPSPAVVPAVAPAPAHAGPPPPVETYAYDPAGRRDPFLNLLGTGPNTDVHAKKGEGAAGLSVGDISVRGIMQSRGSLVAMVLGPDNKTYIVHPGDKFLDGSIKTITPQGLIVMQEVNDPLSPVKQREVRKLLRGLEDAKQ